MVLSRNRELACARSLSGWHTEYTDKGRAGKKGRKETKQKSYLIVVVAIRSEQDHKSS